MKTTRISRHRISAAAVPNWCEVVPEVAMERVVSCPRLQLELISKLPEEYADGRKLDEAEKVDRVVLPTHLRGGDAIASTIEALDDPPSLVATQPDGRPGFCAWHGWICVAIVGAITDEILRLRLDDVEVEDQLHEGDLMVIGSVRGDCERQTVAIDYRHDVHAF